MKYYLKTAYKDEYCVFRSTDDYYRSTDYRAGFSNKYNYYDAGMYV